MNAPWIEKLRAWMQQGADMSLAVAELRQLGIPDTAIVAALEQIQPRGDVYQRFAGLRGNRTWTFMVYLNEGMDGGATIFNIANHAIQPRTGMALLWYNLNDEGAPNKQTLHSGEPVTRGCKIILTKWFRTRGDGPVLQG